MYFVPVKFSLVYTISMHDQVSNPFLIQYQIVEVIVLHDHQYSKIIKNYKKMLNNL